MSDTPTTEQPKRKRGRPRTGRREVYDPTLSISLPDAMKKGLTALARARDTTVSALVRDYLPDVIFWARLIQMEQSYTELIDAASKVLDHFTHGQFADVDRLAHAVAKAKQTEIRKP